MPSPINIMRPLAIVGTVLAGIGAAAPASAQIEDLEILVPSNPGGGWDQTARGVQAALEAEGLASGVQVANVGGGGGTVGLAHFVTGQSGRGDALLMSGLAMVSSILVNDAPVSLEDVTPLARLIGEYEVLVVPAESDIQDLADLMERLKADPGAVTWGAGAAGSTDHLLVGLIAEAAGIEPSYINYIGHSGGGEALASILGGHVTVGVSGYNEFASQIEAGELRALAISSEERVEGIDIPTFEEQGVDVSLTNWRGLMAPGDISEADFTALSDAIAAMVESEAWQQMLEERGWLDLYMPVPEFETFVQENSAQVETVLKNIGLVE